jgi:hypothetical protein
MNNNPIIGNATGAFILMLAVAIPLGLGSCNRQSGVAAMQAAKMAKEWKVKQDKEKKMKEDMSPLTNRLLNQPR